jgi:hypothetical protein
MYSGTPDGLVHFLVKNLRMWHFGDLLFLLPQVKKGEGT